MSVAATDATKKQSWGAGFVRWKDYVAISTSMIVAGAMLAGWILSMHSTAAAEKLLKVEQRLERTESRHAEALKRIDLKLDRVLERR